MSQETSAILCPYCGHTQRRHDRCEACGGSFDPVSRRGVAVNMGPWFLHDQRVPFRPGFNYASMRRLISAGKVTADSILRGPSTQQLWAPARLTPGIAHLVGCCPRCETPTTAEAARCGNCAQPFRPETAYNELGLPFSNAAEARTAQEELDREVARTNGRSRALRLWQNPDVPMLSLCPYCGQWQKSNDRCTTCGGVFDQLSQRATVIAMGPWYVRNKRFPYLPGCSYDVIRRQIDAKRIDASTILRGPTTRQFWSVARNVPGISHLVGHCWSCGGEAKATDTKCAACGSPFGGVDKQNFLGLSFATEEEALQAEQELEAQFNPMMPPTPVAPPPVPTGLASTAATGRGSAVSHAAAGQSAFTGLDRASLAVIAAATLPVEEAVAQAQLTNTSGGASVARSAIVTARPRHRGKARSHGLLVGALALLLVVGAVTAIVWLTKNDPPAVQDGGAKTQGPTTAVNSGATTTGTPSPVTPPPTPTVTSEAAAQVRDQVNADWAQLRDTSRDGQVGLSLDTIADLLAGAESFHAEGQLDKAVTAFREVQKQIDALKPRITQRDEAATARNNAAQLLITIDPSELPDAGIQMLDQTRMRFDEGQIHFDNGDFAQASEVWGGVEDGLVRFEERVTGLTKVQAAQERFEATLDPAMDESMMTLTGGQAWREVSSLLAEARMAAMQEKWDEAVAAYGKAADRTPDVVEAARPLAVRYWSCLAGQLGARAWHDHIEDTTLDPRMRGLMRQLYQRLHIPFQPVDQAMLKAVTKDEVLKIVMLEPAAMLQKNHGDSAVSAFQLGAHLISLSQLLGDEAGTLDEKTTREIGRRLSDLKETAAAAGFNARMTASIQDMSDKLADLSTPASITKARQACDRLLNQLARADLAIDMLRE